MAGRGPVAKGTQLAIGILLLWFAGLCFFVAFMSGKAASLISGTGIDGKPTGPRDVSGLVTRLAANIQAAEGATTTSTTDGVSA